MQHPQFSCPMKAGTLMFKDVASHFFPFKPELWKFSL